MVKRKRSDSLAKQQSILNTAKPLLKKPREHARKQIKVDGAFWEGRQSAQEKATLYKCTIREFKPIYKWAAQGGRVSAAFEMQEMGPDGTGSLEQGDASGEIFHMEYPQPFLKYYYSTFLDDLPLPKGQRCLLFTECIVLLLLLTLFFA